MVCDNNALDSRLFTQVTAFNYEFFEVGYPYKITFRRPCHPIDDCGTGIALQHGTVYAILVSRSIDNLRFNFVCNGTECVANISLQSWINYQDYITIDKLA